MDVRDKMLTGSQIRAARALVNMTAVELSQRTGLAINTVRRAEASEGPVPITAANLSLIRSTLESSGVVFIDAGDLGPGVRLTRVKPTSASSGHRQSP